MEFVSILYELFFVTKRNLHSYFNMHYIRHKYALGMVDDVTSEQHYREKKGKFKVLQSMQCQYAFTSAGYVN